MIKRGRRAQFYIIAAVIISVVLIGLFATTNYIKIKQKDTKLYDLRRELGLEAGYVIDNGIYTEADTDELIEKWTIEYVQYTRTHTGVGDWIFVYGDENKITVLTFTQDILGEVYIDIGGQQGSLPITGENQGTTSFKPEGNNVTIIAPAYNQDTKQYENRTYNFPLKEGENFYFVISEKQVSITGGVIRENEEQKDY